MDAGTAESGCTEAVGDRVRRLWTVDSFSWGQEAEAQGQCFSVFPQLLKRVRMAPFRQLPDLAADAHRHFKHSSPAFNIHRQLLAEALPVVGTRVHCWSGPFEVPPSELKSAWTTIDPTEPPTAVANRLLVNERIVQLLVRAYSAPAPTVQPTFERLGLPLQKAFAALS